MYVSMCVCVYVCMHACVHAWGDNTPTEKKHTPTEKKHTTTEKNTNFEISVFGIFCHVCLETATFDVRFGLSAKFAAQIRVDHPKWMDLKPFGGLYFFSVLVHFFSVRE